MPSGFEGWVSIFEDDSIQGSSFNYPQALFADKETLSFGKEILPNSKPVSNSRANLAETLVYKAAKPEGEIVYQFRSSDFLKVLYSHFQLATVEATSTPYRFSFYPRTNNLDWGDFGSYAQGSYGSVVGKPYTVSVLKKTFDTTSVGGTNSYFFKHGLVDKLAVSASIGEDARAQASFKFRDLDYGTAVSDNPDSDVVGSYALTPAFYAHSATVVMNGASFEVSSFDIQSQQSLQENSRVGRQAPENYQFSGYKSRGNFSFDLPTDAQNHVASMFTGQDFSFVATLYNAASDRVIFNLPKCRRLPFDFQNPGPTTWRGQIPFEAFESNGTFPLKVTVDTDYAFGPLAGFFGDAALGARGAGFATYDAGNSARVLSAYTYYSHS